MSEFYLGNQAVARGAWEAGVQVISSYPGTPSTEITEYASKYPELNTEWATNEKVALEVAYGAAVAGARAMACMKHVGLNVAADPLFTAAYTGIRAGLVIVVADDPGMHSSQNEQDSRFYARSAHIPMLEPCDAEECRVMTALAFELSEQYDTPVLLRLTTRVAHSRSPVELAERREVALRDWERQIQKYVMVPANAKGRHVVVEDRDNRLTKDSVSFSVNREEIRDTRVGVICAGTAYNYVREAAPEVSTLKIGLCYPLPMDLIASFAAKVEKLYVIEELEPYMEDAIRARGISVCHGKDLTGLQGELDVRSVAQALSTDVEIDESLLSPLVSSAALPPRPPALCAGCPHRASFLTMKKLKLAVFGDIGCYTLGAAKPLASMDTTLCMGGSVGMAFGAEKARGREFSRQSVAVIGDSTFLHSGVTPLIDACYNGGNITVVILDNRITGMTGHQQNPASGRDIHGNPAPEIDLEALCRACGAASVRTVNPLDLSAFEGALKEETARDGVSVIIARHPCVLLSKTHPAALKVDSQLCRNCGLCIKAGCPAISKVDGKASIDPAMCVGCGLCQSICPFDAIKGGETK